MLKRRVLAVITALLAMGSTAHAVTIDGSYSATPAANNPTYAPLINDDGGPFLAGSFSETLTVNTPTAATTFIQISPVSGGHGVGTQRGSVNIGLTLTGPSGSAVTGVTTSAGGNGAVLSNGKIDFAGNYELFYGDNPQDDCITWDATSCTPNGSTTTIGETLTVSFADGAVLDISLYNWSDWDMAPDISFDLLDGPAVIVPEPASLPLFATALAGLGMIGLTRRAMPRRS